MKTMKKVMSIALATLMSSSFAMAQKANVKGAEKIADKKGDFNEARTLIKAALENEETKNDPKTMYIAGYVEESYFTSENVKQLEGVEPNREQMNKALIDMFGYYIGTIDMETAANDGNTKPGKYGKKSQRGL